MPVLAVVGGQWGDEGKGKIIDLLAVARTSSSGRRAATTPATPSSIRRGKFALHLVPAGIFNEQTRCLIGPGVALNPEVLLAEMDALRARGVGTDNLVISARAHLVHAVSPLVRPTRRRVARGRRHRHDRARHRPDLRRQGRAHRDRGRRPAPSRALPGEGQARRRAEEPSCWSASTASSRSTPTRSSSSTSGTPTGSARYIAETEPVLEQALSEGRTILLEGGHGTLLDLDHGTYPYVTTTSCTVGGLLNGAGIGPRHLTTAIGVFKAYQSRVGAGAMPSELLDDDRRPHPRARPRVRHDDRPAASDRLVRRRGGAPLDDGQRLPLRSR